MMLEKTPESPLDCEEIKLVNPKGNQSWIFIGRTDVEAESPTLWPTDVKNWLIAKDPGAGEKVMGRKAGGLQTEEIGCKCQTFLSFVSGRRKQTRDIFFLLYTHLKEGFS